MIFAEVASRVGLLGKVNLPRELSERARSTWSEKGKRKERERAEGEKVRQRNDALAMTKRKSERVMVRGEGRETRLPVQVGKVLQNYDVAFLLSRNAHAGAGTALDVDGDQGCCLLSERRSRSRRNLRYILVPRNARCKVQRRVNC